MSTSSGYPLTPTQRNVWFDQLRYPDSVLYNLGGFAHIRGALDADLLGVSLRHQINSHDSMRLFFKTDTQGEPIQSAVAHLEIALELVDLETEPERSWREEGESLFRTPFNLAKAPLFRFRLYRENDKKYHLLCIFHHLTVDGYGVFMFVDRLFQDYQHLAAGGNLDHGGRPAFLQQGRRLSTTRLEKSKAFWRTRLADLPPALEPVVSGRPKTPPTGELKAGLFAGTLPRQLVRDLKWFAAQHQTALFPIFLNAYALCLAHLFDRRRTAVGVSLLNRSGRRGKATLGHFADNTLVVPDVDLKVPFYKNTMAVKRELNQVYRHHGQPFATLAKWGMSQGLSRLFEASFSYETPGFDFNYGDLELDYEALITHQLTHPLHLSIRNYREDRDLLVLLEYQEQFIDAFGAEELTRWFCQILQEAAANPTHTGQQIINAVAERDTRPRQWSKRDTPAPPPGPNVARLFHERAEAYPQRTALVVGGNPTSYATLAKNIHRLATRLRTRHGLQRGEVVGVLSENSASFVIGAFATLQVGGVFLPMNPDEPAARGKELLQRAGARLLLTDNRLHDRAMHRDGIDIVPFEEEAIGLRAAHNLAQAYKDDPVELTPHDTAYLIYTSGTSGAPKAVAVPHGALTNLVTQFLAKDFADLPQPQRIAVIDVFYFDAAYHSLFGALLHGHTLYICPRETAADARQLMLYLEKHEIDGIGLNPRLITQLYSLPAMRHRRLPRGFVETGNEAVGLEEVSRLLDDPARADLRLINYYGPTETCVEVTRHEIELERVREQGTVPIGKPDGGYHILILNRHGDLTPPGFIGEIHIGGPGLAHGYRGDPAATAERFVPSPFGNGARLYRTGDLARWLPDGTIAFVGRLDQQMKVAGYRVEAGEVEHHLKRIEDIRDAAVKMVRNTRGEWQLAAYLEANHDLDTDAVREVLTRALPHYMIPSHFTLVGKLPYSDRGKVNKRALPLPSEARAADNMGPRDDLERLLVYLFSKVLALPEVGIHDNFFALGGQSLSGTRLINELRAEGLNLRFRDLFERPTVDALAKILRRPGHKAPPPIQASAEQSDYPCSHGQERLWLLQQVEQNKATYNMVGAYWLEGNLDRDALELATRLMFQYHGILRTTIHLVNNEPRQRINPMPDVLIKDVDFRDKPDPTASAIRATRRFSAAPFDLTEGPLIRLILIQTETRRYLLSLCLHHIAGDAVSVDRLLEQFSQAYNAYHQGAKVTLKKPRLQYRDYAVWQRGRALLGSWQVSRRFWNNRLADLPEPLLLPIDFQRPPVRTGAGHVVRTKWEPSLTAMIDRLARDRSATRFAVLYALTTAFFYRLTGQDDILLGTPSSGRTHPDLKPIIGFMVNTIVLRSRINGHMNLPTLLEQSAKTIANAFDHGDYPFDLMVEAQTGRRDPSRNPLFDVLITLEQSEPVTINLSELRTEALDIAPNLTKFDLIFNFKRNEHHLILEAQYNTDLFRPTTIDALLQRFTTLASAWAEQPECPLARIHLLSVAEWNRLNSSPLSATLKYRHLFDAFEATCLQFPDRAAVQMPDRTLSYEELGLMTMQLLGHPEFIDRVTPGGVVAVEARRGPEAVAASLAISARGAAFVWLDPRQPREKLAAMFDAVSMNLFLRSTPPIRDGTSPLPEHVTERTIAALVADRHAATQIPDVPRHPQQIAYIVFTSGSTGSPKPIAVSHDALLHQLDATRQDLALRYPAQLHIAGTSSMMFDAAMDEIWATLVDGHTWHPMTEETRRDPHQLLHFLETQTIHTLVTTPSYLDVLLDAGLGLRPLRLETLRLGGEVLKASQIKRLRDRTHSAAVTVFNYYGPSEVCVNATHFQLKPGPASEQHPPIGTAIPHMSVLLMDRDGNPVPAGFTGEICIAGAGLAHGYPNSPRETAAAFRPHPLQNGARIYHSGDLGRLDEQGNLHFLGRRDRQVKIRGYRIECGEIEQALSSLEGVSAAVVQPFVDSSGQWELAAYVVAKQQETAELRRQLHTKLPAYMEPAVFIHLHTLPLSRNGKVDRKALPDPLAEIPDENRGFAAPNDGLERLLSDLWRGVLGHERIGRNDNFFDLGGNSLKAARLAVAIHRRLDTRPATRDLFAHPTIAELAVHLCQREPNLYHPIPKAPQQATYPVSNSQQRLWTARQLAGDSAAYNLPECWWLTGRLNKIALEQAFKTVFAAYQVLRTRFVMEGAELRQIVDESAELPLAFEDFSEENEAEKAALRLAVNEANIPFNLETEVPIRVLLVRTEPTRHLLVVTLHHIAADGWSMPILWSRVAAAYNAATTPLEEAPPAPAIQYVDYAVWQGRQLESGALADQETYWLKQMGGELPKLQLVTDGPRPALRSYKGADHRFRLDGPTSRAVHALSRNQGTTVFSILSSAVFALLYRYSGQSDLMCGVTVAGRRHIDLDQQIGLFLNTLPLRCSVDGAAPFHRLMQAIAELLGDALAHGDYPIDRLIEKLELKPDPARSPLFDVLLVNQDTVAEPPRLPGITATPHEIVKQQAKFDLTFYFQDEGKRIGLALEYNAELFTPERMQQMAGHLTRLIKGAVQEPHRSVGMLDMLTSSERHRLVFGVNQTAFAFDNNYTLGEAFSAGAALYPNRTALHFAGTSHTYAELDQLTNRLANALVAQHAVGAGDFTAIYTRRSDWTVIAILAALKAGAAFVPLDLELPPSRAAFMVKDAGCRLILSDGSPLPKEVAATGAAVVDLRTVDGAESALPARTTPLGPAYAIYTSGSTGKPKGVLVAHRSVMNLVFGLEASVYGQHREHLHEALVAPFIFDASIQQVFGALLLCHTLHVLDETTRRDAATLCRHLQTQDIHIFDITPGLFHALLEAGFGNEPGGNIKHITIGSELVATDLIRTWRARPGAQQVAMTNTYGPTEACVEVTAYQLGDELDTSLPSIPIGKPMPNTRVYLLERDGDLAPIGVPGEICIAGEGLALGYLNRADLTAAAFRPNPWEAGERLYYTGDLAVRLPSGDIVFLGRRDHQVKIHGYRIECGEVEQALLRHPQIEGAVVTARGFDGGNHELVAYLIGEEVPLVPLREHLAAFLPHYMIPRFLVFLERFPLNANNKVDRDKLPDPRDRSPEAGVHVPPRDRLEAKLLDLWRALLGLSADDKLGVHDHFFEKGGHSLTATRLAAAIHRVLGVRLPLRVLFEACSVAAQAEIIREEEPSAFIPIQPIPTAPHYPLSHAQKRLWLLSQVGEDQTTYNIPAYTQLVGDLDVSALRASFMAMMRRHESLRTTFAMVDGEPRQFVHAGRPLPFSEVHLDDLDDADLVAQGYAQKEFNKAFDLSTGPLMRITLLKLEAKRHLLLVTMHHIISDGWSMGIWLKELSYFYTAQVQGRAPRLPELGVQYRDYAHWQTRLLNTPMLQKQRAYWLDQLKGPRADCSMPTAKPRPRIRTANGATHHFQLDPPLVNGLRALGLRHGASLFMTLVALLKVVLLRYSGRKDIRVGSAVANRTHADLEGVIGFFVNNLVLREKLEPDMTFEQVLNAVRQTTTAAYENQDYPFDLLAEELDGQRDPARHPLFDVFVVLQNNELDPPELPHLQLVPFDMRTAIAKFDLMLDFHEDGEALDVRLEYSSDIYTSAGMFRLIAHIVELTRSVLAHPRRPVARLDMLTQLDRIQLFSTFCPDQQVFSQTETVIELFEAAASRMHRETALVYGEKRWTYHQLNQAVNQWAHFLRQEQGIEPGDVVGVLANRDPWSVVALLAVLKAGGVYLPIDPDNPATRRAAIIADAGCRRILVGRDQDLPELAFAPPVYELERLPNTSKINPGIVCHQNDPAYIVYTSGATGHPKGVLGTHRCLYNLVQWQRANNRSMREMRTIQYAPLGFDVSLQEILFTLTTHGELHLIPDSLRGDLPALTDLIQAESIESITMPFSVLNLFLHEQADLEKLASLRHVITSGEQPYFTRGIRRFLEHFTDARLHNQYGPSETHVVTNFTLNHESEVEDRIPLGRPISNSRVYVIDDLGQVAPIGCYGEIWIGGANVGLGYVNQPELTKARFTATKNLPDKTVYRTGDRGRWTEDGLLEFIGRADEQVKIRGYRVEFSEIRRALESHGSVNESAVIVWTDPEGDTQMLAYYASRPRVAASVLRQYIAARLPAYMVPVFMFPLDHLPKTHTGKLDRAALPRPIPRRGTKVHPPAEPTNAVEKRLQDLWQDVLGTVPIGIDDPFFELGGTSLKAMRLVHEIHTKLGFQIRPRDLFQAGTIRRLAAEAESFPRGPLQPLPASGPAAHHPVGDGQLRLWLHQQNEPNDVSYNVTAFYEVKGACYGSLFRKAVETLVARHEILRTTYRLINDELRQIVGEARSGIQVMDLSHLNEEDRHIEAEHIACREAETPFDLATGPVLRATLVRFDDTHYLILLNIHHIAVDGLSLRFLVEELQLLYHALINDYPNPLELKRRQYRDAVAYLRRSRGPELLAAQRTYWRAHLTPLPAPLKLPTFQPRPPVKDSSGAIHFVSLGETLGRDLARFAAKQNKSLFMVLHALVNTLLYRYTGQEDIVIGTPDAGRDHPELADQVGYFVNMLPLRTRVDGNQSFAALLDASAEIAMAAYDHAALPFDDVVAAVNPPTDLSRSPLFDVVLVLQDGVEDMPDLDGLSLKPYPCRHINSRFDLTFNITQNGSDLMLALEYRTALFEPKFMARCGRHFLELAEQVCRRPEQRIACFNLLHQSEWQRLESFQNVAGLTLPNVDTMTLFGERAKQYADELAVFSRKQKLTYAELDHYANGLAYTLLKRKELKGREPVVAVLCEPNASAVVFLLAILKAGAVYLPISQAVPGDRALAMLQDAGAVLLIGPEHLYRDLQAWLEDPLEIPVLIQNKLPRPRKKLTRPPVDLDQAATIIFTSGSTGRPKGVVSTHRGLINTALDQGRAFEISPRDRLLKLADLGFDASLYETFIALFHGASLYCVDYETYRDQNHFLAYIAENEISWALMPPAYMRTLDRKDLPTLKFLISAGESGDPGDLRYYAQTKTVINAYGPTETSVCASNHFVEPHRRYPFGVPLGHPLANCELWVLNQQFMPMPIGVTGEIAIGGPGLARGYLDPRWTAERFVPHPFSHGERLYLTGDLGFWNEQGELVFMGRRDNQVSLHGFRIECGEVAHALRDNPRVKDAYVMVREVAANLHLTAYIVQQTPVTADELRHHLLHRLISYMVPSHYIFLEALPLTANGKIDVKRLPEPTRGGIRPDDLDPPRDRFEQMLFDLFCLILNLEEVSLYDHFFELGGHSLSAIKLKTLLLEHYGITLHPRAVFENPTIADLAQHLRDQEKLRRTRKQTVEPPIPRYDHGGSETYPASFAQQRMWVQHHLGSPAYHLSAAFWVEGLLDVVRLRTALQILIQTHGVLRTAFFERDGQAWQKLVAVEQALDFKVVDIQDDCADADDVDEAKIAKAYALTQQAVAAPFDLGAGKPLRVRLVQLSDDYFLLALTIHHIIADGWTLALFVRQLNELMTRAGDPDHTPEPPALGYGDWAAWQRARFAEPDEAVNRAREFWHTHFNPLPPLTLLPTDHPRGGIRTYAGDSLQTVFDKELGGAMRKLAARQGASSYTTWLTLFAILLYRQSSARDWVVGTVVSGRERTETDAVLGLFANTLALPIHVDPRDSFKQLLRKTHQLCNRAIEYGEYPFDLLVSELDPPRDLAHHPLFDVMFSWQNQDIEDLDFGPAIQFTPSRQSEPICMFDITLQMRDTLDGTLELDLIWRKDLYSRARMAELLAQFQQLAGSALAAAHEPVGYLSFIPPARRDLIQRRFAQARVANYPRHLSLAQLIETRAQQFHDRIALVAAGEKITYATLLNQAREIAHALWQRDIRLEQPVTVSLDRTHTEWIQCLLGIVLAGGVFHYIDPELPLNRRLALLVEAQSTLLFGNREDWPEEEIAELEVKFTTPTLLHEDGREPAHHDELPIPSAANLAYLVATSGTYGTPKLVMVEARALINSTFAKMDTYQISDQDHVLQFAAPTFDVALSEVFTTFFSGACLVLMEREALAPDRFPAFCETHGITVLTLPPSFLHTLEKRPLPGVRLLASSGDKPMLEDVRHYARHHQIANAYGPTETAVCSHIHLLDREPGADERIPVGRPIPNTETYILDELGQSLPVGVVGEVAIAGEGLARGYWEDPAATAASWVPHPFAEGRRLYRTGDRGRWRGDGCLEVLGRFDDMLKIRGFRIHLNEIARMLNKHQAVDLAVVAQRNDGADEPCLVAYLKWLPAYAPPSPAELRHWLGQRLPHYMVPTFYVSVRHFPTGPGGKIQMNRLPEPDPARHTGRDTEQLSLTGEVAAILAEIWSALLGCSKPHPQDHFFELGGHSLRATVLTARVRTELKRDISIRAVFQTPIFSDMAALIEAAPVADTNAVQPAPTPDTYPLTPAQNRLYFLYLLHGGTDTTWHLSTGFRMHGRWDWDAFRRATLALINRHDVLRTAFIDEDGVPMGRLLPTETVRANLKQYLTVRYTADLSEITKRAMETVYTPFQLEKGLSWRLLIVREGDVGTRFYLALHHILIDGWGLSVLLKEWSQLYRALAGNKPNPLRPNDLYFADMAHHLANRDWRQARDFWRQRLGDAPDPLPLPYDYARDFDRPSLGGSEHKELSIEITEALQSLATKRGTTLANTVLAVWFFLMYRLTAREDIVIGVGYANRELPEIQEMVGLFTNVLLIRLSMQEDLTFTDLLDRVATEMGAAMSFGDFPYESVVEMVEPERRNTRQPVVNVMYSFQNFRDPHGGAVVSEEAEQDPDAIWVRPTFTMLDDAPSHATAMFDLTLFAYARKDGTLGLDLEYDAGLFASDTAEYMAQNLVEFLQTIATTTKEA
ncbi:non-ribosomal peptide synthetase [Acanthopleuribacter pedis]|uniref:Amino acid adenylation domain-containing protein n=1 Tax=Acanthopleuribacter pedis TaxID=442870 RepID=A0A8J7U4J7_9BACT|nr:non-ribosomal peptide synthetase [Acanthopleuribacter pedis]MBO1320717.1 amino acid adenylation domain-containing protein [Acanthopleuribacter pedis]